jgi:hypothetical protein
MPLSERANKDRLNRGVFVCGATGTGKSRMLMRLAGMWKRVLIADPTGSLDAEVTTTTYDETVRALHDLFPAKPFRIAAVYDNDAEYGKLFAGLAALLRKTKGLAPPFLLVIDEVDLFSSPMRIEPQLSRLLRYGRHSAMSWAVACRADVETHRDVRMNAGEIILFRQGMLSPHMRQIIKSAEIVREEKLPTVHRLTPHGPKEGPTAHENTHFVAVPDPFDEFLVEWKRLAKAE